MIVLEGTSNTKGKISGDIETPGALSGGFREFMLSDRWFSFDSPIEMELDTITNTGLVEEVKRLMNAYSSSMQMPKSPIAPKPSNTTIPLSPKKEEAILLKIPPIPLRPFPPKSYEDKPWHHHFVSAMVGVGLISIIPMSIVLALGNFLYSIFIGSIIWFAAIPFNLFNSFRANQKYKNIYSKEFLKYTQNLAYFEKMLDDYEAKCREISEVNAENCKISTANFLIKCQQFDAIVKQIQHEKEIYSEMLINYEIEKKHYSDEKENILKKRILLWETSRVCTRCGTAYIGT